jgi:[protein-PII] uridylyltransferase
MGFDEEGVDLIALLVRWHLLLAETATTRDPDDPATAQAVAERVGTRQALDLLTVLTEADARAASPKAWSSWRSGLIMDLSRRTAAALSTGRALPPVGSEEVEIPAAVTAGGAVFSVEDLDDGSRVTAIAPDRVGLLADVSAVFAMQRVRVRAARAWYQDGFGVSVWEVAEEQLQPSTLRQTYDGLVEGRLDPRSRLRPSTPSPLPPSVEVRPEASSHATVLEVRTTDRPGVVHLVCAALAELDVAVRSAHVDTLGPQAVDVFYLQESSAGVLSDMRAAAAAHAVRAALAGGVT